MSELKPTQERYLVVLGPEELRRIEALRAGTELERVTLRRLLSRASAVMLVGSNELLAAVQAERRLAERRRDELALLQSPPQGRA